MPKQRRANGDPRGGASRPARSFDTEPSDGDAETRRSGAVVLLSAVHRRVSAIALRLFDRLCRATVVRGVDELTSSTPRREALKPAITDLPRRVRTRERRGITSTNSSTALSRREPSAGAPQSSLGDCISTAEDLGKRAPRLGQEGLETPRAARDHRRAIPRKWTAPEEAYANVIIDLRVLVT